MSESQSGKTLTPNPSPRRRGGLILKLLLFLLAGAMINVAVAWALLAIPWEWNVSTPREATDAEKTLWMHERPTQFIQDVGTVKTCSRYGVELALLFGDMNGRVNSVTIETGVEDQSDPFELAAPLFTGWPLRTVRGSVWTLSPSTGVQSHTVNYAWANSSRELFLPYRPIFPGFAINTIFYAAIVWGLFAVPGVIRHHVRRKRGQCATCGYSLRGHDSSWGEKCPECGATG